MRDEITKEQASEIAGVSLPTWEKRVNEMASGTLPQNIWLPEVREDYEITYDSPDVEYFGEETYVKPLSKRAERRKYRKPRTEWQLENFKTM